MGAVEDAYFARIGAILGQRVPTASENRVFRLREREFNTLAEARAVLDDLMNQKEELSKLADEVAKAEMRYKSSFFGGTKALECTAVLLTTAQIIPALSSLEAQVAQWITQNEPSTRKTSLTQKKCEHCGKPYSTGDNYCAGCGRPLTIGR